MIVRYVAPPTSAALPMEVALLPHHWQTFLIYEPGRKSRHLHIYILLRLVIICLGIASHINTWYVHIKYIYVRMDLHNQLWHECRRPSRRAKPADETLATQRATKSHQTTHMSNGDTTYGCCRNNDTSRNDHSFKNHFDPSIHPSIHLPWASVSHLLLPL
jgi:hypothetical protein